uniref:Xylanase inhibitor N-terminal domain-containing protein n=1 Tax=Cucumis melo TaxID=3656 RepID=A0A9I9DRB7_CUCME
MANCSLLLLLIACLFVDCSLGLTLSLKLVHRFSDEAKSLWKSTRTGNVSAKFWPPRNSLKYFQMLLDYDLKRRRLKIGSKYDMLFPSEGSQDRDLSEYNPALSSTSKHLFCGHQLCAWSTTCKSPNDPCTYKRDYYSDNTSTSGYMIEDKLHLTSFSKHGTHSLLQASVVLGCGRKQSGSYLDGAAPDGVMGLGPGNISVPTLLAQEGLVRNTFSLCFDNNGSGRIIFGDDGPATQQTTQFLPLFGEFTLVSFNIPSMKLVFPLNQIFIHDPVYILPANQGYKVFCLTLEETDEDYGVIGRLDINSSTTEHAKPPSNNGNAKSPIALPPTNRQAIAPTAARTLYASQELQHKQGKRTWVVTELVQYLTY